MPFFQPIDVSDIRQESARLDTVRSLWIGTRLSRIEILSIRSFLANGHPYHLYVYTDVSGIPPGVVVHDANAIVPERDIFRVAGSLSIFSDWFRQELLFRKGGYWADLDMVCLKPLQFDDPIVIGKVDPARVSNALMRFPKQHPITRQLADASHSPNKPMPYDKRSDRLRKLARRYLLGNRRTNVRWGESSGPAGLTKMARHSRLWKAAKPFYHFYPIHFSFWRYAFDDTFRESQDFLSGSYCVHLWNEKIRRAGMDKDGPFLQTSLIHRLMQRYDCL